VSDVETVDPLAVKIGTVVLGLAAGWLAQRLISFVWEKATGNSAPVDPNDEEVAMGQAIAFAAVSAGVAVLARRLAHKGATKAAAYKRPVASGTSELI
jgi:hypothetical protein